MENRHYGRCFGDTGVNYICPTFTTAACRRLAPPWPAAPSRHGAGHETMSSPFVYYPPACTLTPRVPPFADPVS
jgi:hypothetical protein